MSLDPILDKLNPEQKRAVLARDGAVLIIAGAGSGKTRVLTSRIAMLLREGVLPEQILALTFTNKAAGEMKERIRNMTGPEAYRLYIGTFHSVFVRFLRVYHAHLGFSEHFTIYDTDDSISCLKDCIGEVLFGPDHKNKETLKALSDEEKKERKSLLNHYKPKTVLNRISTAKNNKVTPRLWGTDPKNQVQAIADGMPRFLDIYKLYMMRCRAADAMDFDDILLYLDFLLEKNPQVRNELAQQFRYILVDEYQDTNAVQYDIVRMLSKCHGNICVVGDDSQSIYAFRGAKIQNIFSFKHDFPGVSVFKLETNYRSTPAIVDAANRLIENNRERLPKRCRANKTDGEPIHIERCRDDREEARHIAATIASLYRAGAPWNDHAILYRTNAQSRELETALMEAHIPYTVYSGLSFFERAEIKDAIAYMRLVVNNNDDEAFKRICNRPARGISDTTLSALSAQAALQGTSIFQIARSLTDNPIGIKNSAVANVLNFTETILQLTQMASEEDASTTAQEIIIRSGIHEYYKQQDEGEDGLKRSNNITELLKGIDYFVDDARDNYNNGEAETEKNTLLDYIENISLMSNADTGENGDMVSLMTSHCSKGLEFPTVFVAGAEEGLFPLLIDGEITFDVEEERRLFYVSITRAMNRLYLCHCARRYKYGSWDDSKKSRFVKEMFPEETQEDIPNQPGYTRKSQYRYSNK